MPTPLLTPGSARAPQQGPQEVAQQGEPITAAVEQFLTQKEAEGLNAEYLKQTGRVLQQFTTWAADRGVEGVARVDRAIVSAWKVALLPGRSPATVNAWLVALGGFMRWCEAAGLRAEGSDPVKGQRLKKPKGAREARGAFELAEVRRIFREDFWTTGRAILSRPAHRYLPLLMLYTGARPEELAQLRGRDVREVEGHLVLDLATLDEDQRRKSSAARRLVPVCSVIAGCVQALAGKAGDGRLFPELRPGASGRLAEAPSRWFNETWLRRHCGITDKRKVLYSLRHTVATELKRKGVEESLIAELLGHANASLTTGRYGKRYQVAQLAAAVEWLTWEGIALPRTTEPAGGGGQLALVD